MRKNYRTFIMLLLAAIGLFSCSEEDNKSTAAGWASFYGEKYPLGVGAIYHDNNHSVIAVTDYTFEDRYQGEEGEQVDKVEGFSADVKDGQTGNFLIGLYEQGFIVSDLTQDARGKGACVCLRIASPETDKIVPGKYTCSPNRSEFTFQGNSSVNYDQTGKYEPNTFAEGEVVISREGEIYTIEFNGKTLHGGGPIEGKYTGELKNFDIRKEVDAVHFYQDIKLEGLFEKIDYTDLDGVFHSEPDYLRASSFFRSNTQEVYSANVYKNFPVSYKREIDIALAYDQNNKAVYFESPIKMRALLWHNTFTSDEGITYNFDLPCHTKYMPAPQDFTNADFEALATQKDFAFKFTEAKTSIPVDAPTPCFVFVQTGKGLLGVIRIKEIIPESTEMILGVTYPVNPAIVMDVKFPKSFSEQQIR